MDEMEREIHAQELSHVISDERDEREYALAQATRGMGYSIDFPEEGLIQYFESWREVLDYLWQQDTPFEKIVIRDLEE